MTAFAYDRPSVVHIVVLASGTAAIAAVALVEHRGLLKTRASKAAALALAALLSAGTIGAICPDFFLGPWPHIDPTIHAWHREISELQPLLPFDARGLSAFFAQLSWAVLALPFVLKRLGSGPADDRPMMLLSLIGFAMFIGLALMQERWAGEVQAVMLLPWTLMTVAIMKSEWSITVGHTRVPLRSAMMSGALLLPVIAALLTGHGKNFSPTPHRDAACDWSAAAAVLRNSVPDNAIVVMPLWPGPEVLWRSNSRVVGAPYEMLPAMKDTAAFMDGSEQTARDVVTRRGISYALVCEPGPGFGGRLAQGMAPAWLAPAALKGGPAGFRLYRVAY